MYTCKCQKTGYNDLLTRTLSKLHATYRLTNGQTNWH